MAEIIWTEPALNNLDEIAEYIVLSNLPAAKKLIQSIFQKVGRLEVHPLSGKRVEELPNLGFREVVIDPCRIFYKYMDEKVFILHVMRQEKQLKLYAIEQV